MNFFETGLSPEDEAQLTKILESWKEGELKKMKKALNESKAEQIKKIEESLVDYKIELEETYIAKTNQIIESLKPQLRKQILEEMTDSDPKMIVVDKILEMVYPLIDGNQGKAYVNEIALLKEENDSLKREFALVEGEKKKQELLASYTGKTKKILEKMLGEGTKEEIVQKFYEINEVFSELDEAKTNKKDDFGDEYEDEDDETEEDEEDDDEDDDEEDDKKKKKKDKKDEEMPESFTPTVETSNLNESTSTPTQKPISFRDRIKLLS